MAGASPDVVVNFRAAGLELVGNGLRKIKDEAGPTGRQWGTTSRQIAGGLESIARQGKLTGESLKSILVSGADMALMFGAGGAVAGAIAVTGAAIYEHIVGGIKAAREENRKFQEEVAGYRRSGNLSGAGDLSQRLYSGDRYAVQQDGEDDRAFRARQGGVLGIRSDIARLRNIQDNGATQRDRITAFNEIAKLNPILKQYEDRARAAATAVSELATAEGRRLAMVRALALGDIREAPVTTHSNQLIGGPGGAGRFLDEIVGARRLGTPGMLSGFTVRGAARPSDNPATVAMVEGMRNAGELAGKGFVDTLASTIETGVARVFQKGANIGTVFAAIAESALSGLGSIAVSIGKAALTQFAFIKTISTAIASLNPAIGIAAAIGLIAFGSALGGAGQRIGANAGGGGYGGGGGAYGASSGYGGSIIDRGIIDPTRPMASARSTNQYNVTIIGPNDPIAKRQFQELLRNADGRGSV